MKAIRQFQILIENVAGANYAPATFTITDHRSLIVLDEQ